MLRVIPVDFVNIVPKFQGDRTTLSLFLRKCEYIIKSFRGGDGNVAQNTYLMHVLTSRLTGQAAALRSEREDVITWLELKNLLIQHFGDPRSEECIAIELEGLKIRQNESFLEFCNRIQSARSNLIAKVNALTDTNLKESKVLIYNHMTLNVFLYNLPEDLVRIVRLKSPKTLEDALTVVLEEVNFRNQYNSKNKNKDAKPADTFRKPFTTNSFQFGMRPQQSPSHTPQGFKVPFNTPQQQSNQRNPMNKPNFPQFGTNVGYRPNLFQYNNSATRNPQFGYR